MDFLVKDWKAGILKVTENNNNAVILNISEGIFNVTFLKKKMLKPVNKT